MTDADTAFSFQQVVRIGDGHNDDGAWHRAVMLAEEMARQGVWNRRDGLMIHDPYELHTSVFGLSKISVRDLEEGRHYEFFWDSATGPEPIFTPMRYEDALDPDFRQYQSEPTATLQRLFDKAGIPARAIYTPSFGSSATFRRAAHAHASRESLKFHIPGMSYVGPVTSGGLKIELQWNASYALALEEPLIAEPRYVDVDHVAITAICPDCGCQHDEVFKRAVWEGDPSICYAIAESIPFCSCCFFWSDIANFFSSEIAKPHILHVQPLPSLHLFDDDLPEPIPVPSPDIDPTLQTFLREHGDDTAALQQSLVNMTDAYNDLLDEVRELRAAQAKQAVPEQKQKSVIEVKFFERDGLGRNDYEREFAGKDIAKLRNEGWLIAYETFVGGVGGQTSVYIARLEREVTAPSAGQGERAAATAPAPVRKSAAEAPAPKKVHIPDAVIIGDPTLNERRTHEPKLSPFLQAVRAAESVDDILAAGNAEVFAAGQRAYDRVRGSQPAPTQPVIQRPLLPTR